VLPPNANERTNRVHGVGKKKRLSEHVSELALPRGGGNPRFRTFAGLNDGTLGQAGVYKPTEIIATSCGIHLWRPLSQKSFFLHCLDEEEFLSSAFSRRAQSHGRLCKTVGSTPVTGRPSLHPGPPAGSALFSAPSAGPSGTPLPPWQECFTGVAKRAHFLAHQGRHISGAHKIVCLLI
jgi:hypothetical protein